MQQHSGHCRPTVACSVLKSKLQRRGCYLEKRVILLANDAPREHSAQIPDGKHAHQLLLDQQAQHRAAVDALQAAGTSKRPSLPRRRKIVDSGSFNATVEQLLPIQARQVPAGFVVVVVVFV
jgi:hypothetical protein